MERRRITLAEAVEFGRSMPVYDRRGRRLPRRAEWEQLSRWRRWRDILLACDPPREYKYSWERD